MKKFWTAYIAHYAKSNFVEVWFKLFFMVVMCLIFSLFLPVIPWVFCVGFILSDPFWFYVRDYKK
jgi:hypothetical protein